MSIVCLLFKVIDLIIFLILDKMYRYFLVSNFPFYSNQK